MRRACSLGPWASLMPHQAASTSASQYPGGPSACALTWIHSCAHIMRSEPYMLIQYGRATSLVWLHPMYMEQYSTGIDTNHRGRRQYSHHERRNKRVYQSTLHGAVSSTLDSFLWRPWRVRPRQLPAQLASLSHTDHPVHTTPAATYYR